MLWPSATWVGPTSNRTPGGVTRPPHGLVLHTADGTYDGTIAWQRDPQAQVSSYLIVAQDGRVAQMVDFNDKAWTQSAGNSAWIGIEHEGHGDQGQPLTPQQIEVDAQFFAWCHQHWGVPLQLTDDPDNGRGLGWHGMGGQAWGGHLSCPGQVIIGQRPQILARAQQIVGGDQGDGFGMGQADPAVLLLLTQMNERLGVIESMIADAGKVSVLADIRANAIKIATNTTPKPAQAPGATS